MRRFVAFITFLALMSSTFVSASAATITSSDNFHSETVSILGTEVSIKRWTDDKGDYHVIATAGEDVAERINNELYLNGVRAGTITEKVTSIEPRTGWVDGDNCPLGSPSDYTVPISEKDVDVNLDKEIFTYTVSGIASIIGLFVPTGVAACLSICSLILSSAYGTKYDHAKTLYYHEEILGHKTLPNMYRRVNCTYYFDKAHNEYAGSGTYYKSWG